MENKEYKDHEDYKDHREEKLLPPDRRNNLENLKNSKARIISAVFLFLLFGLVFYIGPYAFYTLSLVIVILAYEEWVTMTKGKPRIIQLLGIFTVILPNSSLVYLYMADQTVFFWLLITVIINDMFAYIVGKNIGGYKLIPSVSPGKTWSGFFGGAIAGLAAGSVFSVFAGLPINFTFLSGLMAILGSLGDLSESAIKRYCHVKDSSNIIPGHGGVLDRLDSFIFTAPFAVYLIH